MPVDYNNPRYALVSRQIAAKPELKLLLKDDGCRIWVREFPHTSVSTPDDWELLWEYKHYDVPGYVNPVIDALMVANAVQPFPEPAALHPEPS